MHENLKRAVKFVFLIAFILFGVYLVRYSPLASKLTYESIKTLVESFGLAGVLVFISIYAIGTLISIPGTVLTFAGAVLYGPWLGTIVNVVGATIGASFAFFAASYLGRDFIERLMHGKLDAFQRRAERDGFKAILLLRLVPLFPFVGINYAAGLTRIRFKDYFLATLIGIIPGGFVYTYLFATLGDKILTSGFHVKDLMVPEVLIALGLFASLIAISTMYRRRVKDNI